jgi:ketosteroid isomerase-like protein
MGGCGSALAAFEELWGAFGIGRMPDRLDLVHPEVEVRPAFGDRVYHGHDGVRQWLDHRERRWKSIVIAYDEVREIDEDTVVALGQVTAFDRGGGRRVDSALAWVAEFDEGRLVRGSTFVDPQAALAYALRRGT